MTGLARAARLPSLDRIGARLAHWIRGGKPAPTTRWPAYHVMNLVSGTALACVLGYAIFTNFVGIGMAPVLKCIEGELFIYGKSQSKNIAFERGETYVFRWPFQTAPGFGQSIVKKLAGVPGDQIRVDAKGVWINGALWGPLNERVYTKMQLAPKDFMRSYTLGNDEFLMLGTLPSTFDGRYIGPIKRHAFVGQVWVVL